MHFGTAMHDRDTPEVFERRGARPECGLHEVTVVGAEDGDHVERRAVARQQQSHHRRLGRQELQITRERVREQPVRAAAVDGDQAASRQIEQCGAAA